MLTLVLSHALRYRIREGCKVALAPLLTDPPIIGAAVVLSVHIRDMQPLLAGLSLLGALYLLYLGYETMQVTGEALHPDQTNPQSLLKGVLTNYLNPHPYLFWFTVGAPLLSGAGSHPLLRAAFFLSGFYICLVGAKMLVAWIAGSARFLVQGRIYAWTMRILGLALWGFALSLILQAWRLLEVW
jgi:threonine/homoserine/homoserine lactone efflux protein